MDANNYYEALEITPKASHEEIYQAYQRSKNAYSEESLALYSLMSKSECQEIMNSIEEAYSILSEPSKRTEYDKARGFAAFDGNHSAHYQEHATQSEDRKDAHKFERYSNKSVSQTNKLTALSKFSLEFKKDLEMESRIENAETISGQFLKEIREYKGVSQARLAEMSRISLTNINRIESDRFDELPAKAYIRGFAFQIARCLKLNADQVARAYMLHMQNTHQAQ